MNVDAIVEALLAGRIANGPLVAALPMYDWPEQRRHVDAQWVLLRNALRLKGVDAPERLARCNADLSRSDLAPDAFDLGVLWRHPNLLFAQTCWGPMEAGLAPHVRVVGQEDYAGVEGGDGEFYRSAIVMRAGAGEKFLSAATPTPNPPHKGEGDSPSLSSSPLWGDHAGVEGGDGEFYSSAIVMRAGVGEKFLSAATPTPNPPHKGEGDQLGESPSPLGGGLGVGVAALHALLNGLRLAYNASDSMSGYLALERELGGLEMFSERLISGGHRASIQMVANGAADVAAVDCKTWALALQHEPAAQELVVVGWTGKRKGLPFITAKVR